ncbi:hypothetical protein BDQ12DRAFT_611416 [Crucibulum laeve]|uniref:F-box domain-containing protein n=1 Tax=Crucibulum laeve TaxID=68775 RepID=A0A5C3LRZ6_9AGAR|nr:hypothetical protein BDQ12DRAFT_611416 [Crucibulum laeve]
MVLLTGPTGTSAQRVLTRIPELLHIIFSSLDQPSHVSNARVCSEWREAAMDYLWKEVNDLHRLFNALVPLQKTAQGEWEFSRLPETADWNAFERYTRRVRSLAYHTDKAKNPLRQSVFDDVARTRTTLAILPNMLKLDWNADFSICVLFMTPIVKHFILNVPPGRLPEANTPRAFFTDIGARMPNITYVDFRSLVPINRMESELIELFESLPKLQKLTLPRFFFTTRLAESLSQHKELGTIEFQYDDEQGYGDPQDTAVFTPNFVEGAFPALWDLSMTIRFKDAARFLDVPFAPTNLTVLYLDSEEIETPQNIYTILKTVSENCVLLKALTLVSLRDPDPDSEEQEQRRITMDDLRPLLRCPNLTSLELVHQYPLDIYQDDVASLAASWPSLENLLLNNEPVTMNKSTLTLRALLPFARHCPKLHSLGLFIDASAEILPSEYIPDSVSVLTQHPPFESLRKLSMGVSIIEEAGPVALSLSHIVPLSCKIDSGITWEESPHAASEVTRIINMRCTLWDEVGQLLPLLTRLRTEERKKTEALQREVEDLRMRSRVMMDKLKKSGKDGGEASDACIAL